MTTTSKYRLARFRGVAHLVSEGASATDPALCGARPSGIIQRGWNRSEKRDEGRVCVVCQWAEFEEMRKEKQI